MVVRAKASFFFSMGVFAKTLCNVGRNAYMI